MKNIRKKIETMGKMGINLHRIIFISLFLVIMLLFVVWFLNRPNYDALAKCLSEKNVTMYGTEWCTHCQAQKKMFGSSFQYINFIDCDASKDICDREGITVYPTWDIGGHKVSGEMKADALSKLTGCPIKSETN